MSSNNDKLKIEALQEVLRSQDKIILQQNQPNIDKIQKLQDTWRKKTYQSILEVKLSAINNKNVKNLVQELNDLKYENDKQYQDKKTHDSSFSSLIKDMNMFKKEIGDYEQVLNTKNEEQDKMGIFYESLLQFFKEKVFNCVDRQTDFVCNKIEIWVNQKTECYEKMLEDLVQKLNSLKLVNRKKQIKDKAILKYVDEIFIRNNMNFDSNTSITNLPQRIDSLCENFETVSADYMIDKQKITSAYERQIKELKASFEAETRNYTERTEEVIKDNQNKFKNLQEKNEELLATLDKSRSDFTTMQDTLSNKLHTEVSQKSKQLDEAKNAYEQVQLNLGTEKNNLEIQLNKVQDELDVKIDEVGRQNDQIPMLKQSIESLQDTYHAEIGKIKNEGLIKVEDQKQRFDQELAVYRLETKEDIKFERSKNQAYIGQINELLKILNQKESQMRTILPEIVLNKTHVILRKDSIFITIE